MHFLTYDLDGSQVLELDELKLLAVELCCPMSNKQLKDALRLMDKDGSSTVDFEEFREWWFGDEKDRGKGSSSAIFRALLKAKLKATRFLRSLTGSYFSRRARRNACAKICKIARAKARDEFREKEPRDYWYHFHHLPTLPMPKGIMLEIADFYQSSRTASSTFQ